MHRIDGPGATVDNRFTDGDPVAGIQATMVTDDWANDIQEELMSLLTAAGISPIKGTQNQVLAALRTLSPGVVGTLRNARMSVPAPSATATFTADQVIVGASLSGAAYRLNSFSRLLNLSIVGAGGMDVGAAPINGFVSVYAIYHPTAQVTALLACDQAVSSGHVYSGPNMPAGFTSSSLVSAWGTNASRLLVAGSQLDRDIDVATVSIFSTTSIFTNSPVSMNSILPVAAVAMSGLFQCGASTASVNSTVSLASTSLGIGSRACGGTSAVAGAVTQCSFSDVKIITPRTAYITSTVGSGSLSQAAAYLTSYKI